MLAPWKKSYDKPRQHIKRHYFPNKGTHLVKAMVFPVVMYGCEKEGWAPKNWCFWTVVLEKTLEIPLDCKEIKPVYPKENQSDQSWTFIGRTEDEAEALILWPLNEKNWLIGKDPDAGEDWGQEEKRTTEDEMAGMVSLTWCTWVWLSSGSW